MTARKHVIALVTRMGLEYVGRVNADFSRQCPGVAWKAAVIASGIGRAEAFVHRGRVHALSHTSPAPIAPVVKDAAVSQEVHAVGHVPAPDAASLTVAEGWAVLEAATCSATIAAVVASRSGWVDLAGRLA